MSDFKLLLKRRHLLTQSNKSEKDECAGKVLQRDDGVNMTGVVGKGAEQNGGEDDCDGGQCARDVGHSDSGGRDEDRQDEAEHHTEEVTQRGRRDREEVMIGSSLEDLSQVISHTISPSASFEVLEHQNQQDIHNSKLLSPTHLQDYNNDNSNGKKNNANSEDKSHKRVEKKDLIFSAGTIRNRYREVRKEEESRLQKKHDRTMQKHSLALLRESLGQQSSCEDFQSTMKKKCTTGEGRKIKSKTKGSITKKDLKTSFSSNGNHQKGNDDNGGRGRNRDQLRQPLQSCGTPTDNIPLSLEQDSSYHFSSEPLRQSQSSLALSSMIRKENANDSIEELMHKYYEHEIFQEKLESESENEKKGEGEKRAGTEQKQELETVILTESVPFIEYPVNMCIIDGLLYSKFCMDAVYKGDIITIAKKALQQRRYVLLRSPLHYLTAADATHISNSSNNNSVYLVTSRDATSDADRLRECKQILKSIFMTCVAFSSEPLPPAITERTTIQREVTRPLLESHSSQSNYTSARNREEQILNGKSISEFVELEMLIPPKSY